MSGGTKIRKVLEIPYHRMEDAVAVTKGSPWMEQQRLQRHISR